MGGMHKRIVRTEITDIRAKQASSSDEKDQESETATFDSKDIDEALELVGTLRTKSLHLRVRRTNANTVT